MDFVYVMMDGKVMNVTVILNVIIMQSVRRMYVNVKINGLVTNVKN